MAWCLINLDEGNKASLGIAICVICILQTFVGLAILGLIAYFNVHLQWKVALIEGYDARNLYLTIISLGVIIVVLHCIGSKMCYDCGFVETRARFEGVLFVWVTFAFLLAIVEFVVSISCFAHTLKAYLEFQSGLYNTIQLYGNDSIIKYKLDKLQLEDECCGAEGFHDWMLSDWTPPEFNPYILQPWMRAHVYDDDFFKDVPPETLDTLEPHHLLVVPFSCCDRKHDGPCYHDYITQSSLGVRVETLVEGPVQKARNNWWTTSHGLFENGCAQILLTSYNNYLNNMGFVFLAALGVELVILVLARFLETSLSNMVLLGDSEKGISPGWLCEGCGDSVV